MNISMNNPYINGIIAKESAVTTDLNDKFKNEKASDKELMDACKEFEAYLIENLFKEMKKTVNSDEENGDYMKYFSDVLYKEYAYNSVEKGEFNIAKQLFESMKKNNTLI